MTERTIEVDLANERIVLATMIHDPAERRRLSNDLAAEDFGEQKHRTIFRGLKAMARAGLSWSEDTLAELQRDQDFGGFAYLRALQQDYDPNANVDFHVGRLRLDAAKLELLQDHLPAIAEAAEDPTSAPERVGLLLRKAQARVDASGRRFDASGGVVAEDYYSTLRVRKVVGGVVDGFGFTVLDSVLVQGLAPGTLVLVVARPGMGKSTMLAQLIRHRARTRRGTFVCGWEMSRADYLDMIVAAETGIPGATLYNAVGSLTPEQKAEVQRVIEAHTEPGLITWQENPFTKLPKPASRWDYNDRNLDHFEGTVAKASSLGQTVVALDVVGKMIHDRRPDSITEVMVRLRELGQAYGVCVLALHHLNRDAAQGRPTMEGIKGSGAFEEEADLIFGLDRPILRASAARRRKMQDVLDVHILKQRRGPAPVCVRYRFEGARYALSSEVEVDLAMLEKDEGEDAVGV